MAERHLRNCSTSLTIKEMSIKATLRWHLMSVNLAKIKDIDDSICWSKGKTLPQLVRVKNLFSNFGNQYGGFSEIGNQSTSRPSNTTLVHTTKRCTIITQGHLLNRVHSRIIHSIQNVETN